MDAHLRLKGLLDEERIIRHIHTVVDSLHSPKEPQQFTKSVSEKKYFA